MERYVSPRWLPGGNLQTIWPALWSRRHDGPQGQRQRARERLLQIVDELGLQPLRERFAV